MPLSPSELEFARRARENGYQDAEITEYIRKKRAAAQPQTGVLAPSPQPDTASIFDQRPIATPAPPRPHLASDAAVEQAFAGLQTQPAPGSLSGEEVPSLGRQIGTTEQKPKTTWLAQAAILGDAIRGTSHAIYKVPFDLLRGQAPTLLEIAMGDAKPQPGERIEDFAAQRGISPESARAMQYISAVNPFQMLSLIPAAADITNDAAKLISPFLINLYDKDGRPKLSALRIDPNNQTQMREAAKSLLNSSSGLSRALLGLDADAALTKTFESEGLRGLYEQAFEQPDLVAAALGPLAIAAGAWADGAVKGATLDTFIKQRLADRKLNALRERVGRLPNEPFITAQDVLLKEAKDATGHQADPAMALAVRLLTRVREDGKVEYRPLQQGLAEEFGWEVPQPEGKVVTPAEALQQKGLKATELALQRLSAENSANEAGAAARVQGVRAPIPEEPGGVGIRAPGISKKGKVTKPTPREVPPAEPFVQPETASEAFLMSLREPHTEVGRKLPGALSARPSFEESAGNVAVQQGKVQGPLGEDATFRTGSKRAAPAAAIRPPSGVPHDAVQEAIDLALQGAEEARGGSRRGTLRDRLYGQGEPPVHPPGGVPAEGTFRPGGPLQNLGGKQATFRTKGRTFTVDIAEDPLHPDTAFVTGLISNGNPAISLKEVAPELQAALEEQGYSKVRYRPDNEDARGAARTRLFNRIVSAEGTLRPSGRPYVKAAPGETGAEIAAEGEARARREANIHTTTQTLEANAATRDRLRPGTPLNELSGYVSAASDDVLRNGLSIDEAASLGKVVKAATPEQIARINRIAATAVKAGGPTLLADTLRGIASHAEKGKPLFRPTAARIAALPEPDAPAPSPLASRADITAMADQMGADMDQVRDQVGKVFGPDRATPFWRDEPVTPTEAAARKARGVGLDALRDAAAQKSLTVQRDGLLIKVLDPNAGIVYEGEGPLAAADAIDAYKPEKPSQPPVKPTRRTSRVQAEFLGLQTLYDSTKLASDRIASNAARIAPKRLNDIGAATTAAVRAARLYTLTPSQLSKNLPGRVHSLLGQFGPEGEKMGNFIVGEGFRAMAEQRRIVEGADAIFERLLDELPIRRRGVSRSLNGPNETEHGVFDLLNTAILSQRDEAGGDWRPAISGASKSDALSFSGREGVTPAEIARARRTWDKFTPRQRDAVVSYRLLLDSLFDQVKSAELKGWMYKTVEGVGRQAERPGGVPQGIALGQAREAAGTPNFKSKIGPRIDAYVGHMMLESLRDNVLDSAALMAPPEVRTFLSTDLPAAMQASASQPFRPSDNPSLVFTDKVPALRHLLGNISDADLGEFIRESSGAIKDSASNIEGVTRALPSKIFSRFLQKRTGEDPNFLHDLQRFHHAYTRGLARKIAWEPTLAKIEKTRSEIIDPVMQRAFAQAITNMQGRRGSPHPGVDAAIRSLVAHTYNGVLLMAPHIALANSTQVPLWYEGALATHVPTASALAANPRYLSWLVDRGLVQTPYPSTLVSHLSKTAEAGDAFAITRSAKEFGDKLQALWEAPSPRAAKNALRELRDMGFTMADMLGTVETMNRIGTASLETVQVFEELGLLDKLRKGDLASFVTQHPALAEHLERRILIAQGNTNFFLPDGANQPLAIGALTRSKHGAFAEPFTMLSSYPTGMASWLNQNITDALAGSTPALRRGGRVALARLFTHMTLLAGPRATAFWVDELDDDTGQKGKLRAAFDKWEDKGSLAGLLAAYSGGEPRAWARAIGLGQATPVPTVPLDQVAAWFQGRASNPAPRALDSAFVARMGDLAAAVSGKLAHWKGAPLTQDQVDAIQKFYPIMAPDYVSKPDGPLGQDATLLIPSKLLIAIARGHELLVNALDAMGEEKARPGAVLDSKGRPQVVRDATERLLRSTFGPSRTEGEEREKIQLSSRRDAEMSRLKQQVIRSFPGMPGEDPKLFSGSMRELAEKYPTFKWNDWQELSRDLKREQVAASLTKFERMVYSELSDEEYKRVTAMALDSLEPGKIERLSPEQRRQAAAIALLGMSRALKQRASSSE